MLDKSHFLSCDSTKLPKPFDAARLQRGFEAWRDQCKLLDDESLRTRRLFWSEQDIGQKILAMIFGNSPFLSDCLLKDPNHSLSLLEQGPEKNLTQTFQELRQAYAARGDRSHWMQQLRIARRRVALTVAMADLAGFWDLTQVTRALSQFADLAIGLSVDFLIREVVERGQLVHGFDQSPGQDSGYIVLAMGKYGAYELNYSSDIDLIVLWDGEIVRYQGNKSPGELFVRLTRDLVTLLNEATGDGYVFRMDLRLRPDAGATPIAINVDAAEHYYASLGQVWERAAMIKARAVAGDIRAGEDFLQRIAPFVWRKHLDFAAIEDIQSIKRQIHAHHGFQNHGVLGHNIKLGRGGIREIELFVQTQQLISGGRDRKLRGNTTLGGLAALLETGRISQQACDELTAAYLELRRLEHRLQMINDEQTQTLPNLQAGLDAFATFAGFSDTKEFSTRLLDLLRRVSNHYDQLFESSSASVPQLPVIGGDVNDPMLAQMLANMPFQDSAKILDRLSKWYAGQIPATRSPRAREKLKNLLPMLLTTFARRDQPDLAFQAFDHFLEGLPAGVQLFSLLYSNPQMLEILSQIMGDAPRLSNYIARRPAVLDVMLSPDFFTQTPTLEQLVTEATTSLLNGQDMQEYLDIARRWVAEKTFQVGVQMLVGQLSGVAAGPRLADIAQSIMSGLLPLIEQELIQNHGRIVGGSVVLLAMGKFGSAEMSPNSDIDLILIYDVGALDAMSSGRKPLPAGQYYARLTQRLINALTAPTAEGVLYDLDMRLRPSGNKGPIATSLASFIRYQQEAAWTWEHQALTRGRVVCGNIILQNKVTLAIADVLQQKRDSAKLRQDVLEMRDRLTEHKGSSNPWKIKTCPGGLIDIEFINQFLQLKHAHQYPQICLRRVDLSLLAMSDVGVIPKSMAKELAQIYQQFLEVIAFLALGVEGEFEVSEAPPGLKRQICRALKLDDFAAVEPLLLKQQQQVQTYWREIFEWKGIEP